MYPDTDHKIFYNEYEQRLMYVCFRSLFPGVPGVTQCPIPPGSTFR